MPIVMKVHGKEHPEILDVGKVYSRIVKKLKKMKKDKPDLDNEFEEIREITSDYQIPAGVCESYQAIYQMLEKLDQAYQA